LKDSLVPLEDAALELEASALISCRELKKITDKIARAIMKMKRLLR
jgi:hypothetical protein